MNDDVFDLSTTTEQAVERGGILPIGWYLAKVQDVVTEPTNNALKVSFSVIAGPHSDHLITDTLWNPGNADDAKKAKISQNRRILFARRLGLIATADFGKAGVRVRWTDAIGRRVWINVEHHEYDKKDKTTGKPTGQKGMGAQLKFDGIYPADDERVPEDVRQAVLAGKSPAAGAVGTQTATPAAATAVAKREFGDL